MIVCGLLTTVHLHGKSAISRLDLVKEEVIGNCRCPGEKRPIIAPYSSSHDGNTQRERIKNFLYGILLENREIMFTDV